MADASSALLPSVAPDTKVPDDLQHIQANPSSFGGAIAQGEEKAGTGISQAGAQLFDIAQFKEKVNADYSTNNFTDARNKLLYGDPSKPATGPDGSPVKGPDGRPMPDTGYFGLQGSAAAYQRESVLKQLKDLREQERNNLASPQAQLEYDAQTRRLYSDAEQRIGQHAETQYKTWVAGVNDDSAKHSLDGYVANLDNAPEKINHAKDYIDYRVRNAQLKYGDDPTIVSQTVAQAKQDLLKAEIATKEVTDPSAAQRILDKNRDIAGADYPQLAERLRGRVDQQDGISDADRRIAASSARPYANASNPSYAAAAAANPGGMSANGIARTVQLESGGNPDSGKGTNHVGLGSFDAETAAGVGITNRSDPEQSVRGIAALSAKNAPALAKALGHAPDDTELYLAHQQGANGASKLLSQPNARAGDLVGDEAIRQNGGDPNAPARAFTSMWKQKFDGASLATGEAGNGAALSHREGELKLAILNDPDMTANPQKQNAALSRVGQVFAAQRLTLAQDDAAFKVRLQNTKAEALDTGAVTKPIAREEFIGTYGSQDGEKEYQEYLSTVQLGGDIKATASMTPNEITALRAQYVPKPGAEDYIDQVKRRSILEKAIAANDEAKKDDPAAYVTAKTEVGKTSFAQLVELTSDPQTSPAMKTAYAQIYASKILAEEDRLGIPREARSVVPESYAKPIRDKITTAATSEDPKDRVGVIDMIKQQQQLWGEAWPEVAPKLAPPGSLPLVKAAAAGADPEAIRRLLTLPKEEAKHPSKILKEQNEVTARNLQTALNTELAPFKSSMVGIQRDRDYNGYFNLATELASLYVGKDGMGEKEAAQKAFNDLIGNRYTFADTYRIPKDPAIDPAAIQRGAYEARQSMLRGVDFQNNLPQAKADLNLNPQEQALYQRHLTNLGGAGGVDNPDGSRSSLYQSVQEHDGKFYNVPTVWNGKIETEKWTRPEDGKVFDVPNKTAMDNVRRTGWDSFPSYASAEEADARYDAMHKYMERDTGAYQQARAANPFGNITLQTNDIGLSDNEADSRSNFSRDGIFVTSPRNDGLNLAYHNGFVSGPDGRPILLTWAQLAQMGGTKEAKATEATRALQGSEQMP